VPGVCDICIPGIFIWLGVALGCVDGVCSRLLMPGMFISIFSGVADEGDDCGLAGICIPGMDMSMFRCDGEGVGDGPDADD
jgi:hypothetical protein